MQSFMKINPSQNGKITLSFIDIGKLCLSREFFKSLICILMLFAKINFSRKFLNLQYAMDHSYLAVSSSVEMSIELLRVKVEKSVRV